MKRNPDYEAGFIRAVDHEQAEQDPLIRAARAAQRRRLVVIGGIAVVAVVAIGFAIRSQQDTPARQFERASDLSARNAHAEAIVEVKRSLMEEPDQPAARALLGHELLLLGDWKGAEIEFRKALEAKYQPDLIYPQLVTCLLRQEKFERVVTMVNGTTVASPQANADLRAQLGTAYYALGKEKEAAAAWRAAKDFVPGHPGALIAEATALVAKGSYGVASSVIDGIPPTAPRQDQILALRGDIARGLGKPDEAATAYEAAATRDPGNLVLRASLAETYVDLGRHDDASRHIDAILAAKPNDPKAEYLAARAAYGRKDYASAYDAITKSVQQTPRDGRGHLLAGRIALDGGRLNDAELHLREAIALMPQAVEGRRLLATLYLQRKEAEKAEEVIRPAFVATPENKQVAAIVAQVALLQGDPVKAAKAYDAVDADVAGNVDASLASAALKFAAGDRAGGFARLRLAAIASPGNPAVDTALVTSYLQMHQVKEALTAWNALAARQPSDPKTWKLLAAIDRERGDNVAARRSLEKAIALDAHDFPAVDALTRLDIAEQKTDDARERLQQYIATTPGTVEPILRLVGIERGPGGQDAQVLALLRDARKIDPKSIDVARALVAYHVEHIDAKQAFVVADEALLVAPNDVPLLQAVGELALTIGDTGRAIASYTKLSALDVQSADFPERLGIAQLAAGQPEPALAAYRYALLRQPDNAERHLAMTGALLAAGKADEAGRLQFEINRLSPKSPALPEIDADVKLGKKLYPEAIDAYRAALAARPTSRLAIKTYKALYAGQDRTEAATFLADWIRAHPSDETVRVFDVDQAMQAKDYRRAADSLRALVAAHPNDARIVARLARCLAQLDDAQALAYAEKANALAPDDASINDTYGWLLVERGDAARGLALLEKASRAAPQQRDIRLRLARAQIREGRKDAARATLQTLIGAAPDSDEGRASQTLLATLGPPK